MTYTKVDICGVDTSDLPKISSEEKLRLLIKSHNGDNCARELLISSNLRLVLSIIQKFANRHDNMDDLFQVGCIGLIKAIDNFNTELDVKFSTYAVPMIIGELKRFLRDNNTIRVSRSVRDLAYRSLKSRELLLSSLGYEPTYDQIANDINEDVSSVRESLNAISETVSLYDPIFNDGGDSLYIVDQICDYNNTDDMWLDNIALLEAMKLLTEREKTIIDMRYYSGKTQMEIAHEIGISQAQVSRLEKCAYNRIKNGMKE